MFARLATSWTVLRIAVEERLIYRADFALGTLMRFLPIVTQIFLWAAVFSGRSMVDHKSSHIAGYSLQRLHRLLSADHHRPGRFPACRGWPPASPAIFATAR